ncbi:hypothetical protein GmHk_04G010185 [Glycine max]|nr:hypothetical protein GmHk_04G010185 [Glycine max]
MSNTNYTPPNVAQAPDENVDNSALIPIESQQPQSGHVQTFCGVPLPNTLGGLNIAHNPNPYILQWEEGLLLWWKGRNLII